MSISSKAMRRQLKEVRKIIQSLNNKQKKSVTSPVSNLMSPRSNSQQDDVCVHYYSYETNKYSSDYSKTACGKSIDFFKERTDDWNNVTCKKCLARKRQIERQENLNKLNQKLTEKKDASGRNGIKAFVKYHTLKRAKKAMKKLMTRIDDMDEGKLKYVFYITLGINWICAMLLIFLKTMGNS